MKKTAKQLHILVTRPEHQAGFLIRMIEKEGWIAVKLPTLEIQPVQDQKKITEQLKQLANYDYLIFISANAVNFALQANGGKIETFRHSGISAIGKATAKALEGIGLQAKWLPKNGYNSEALLELPVFHAVRNKEILIIRGQGGREKLAECLRSRGAKVDYLEVYRRKKPICDTREVAELLRRKELDFITVTSNEALNNLLQLLPPQAAIQALEAKLVVISERMQQMAETLGFKRITIAKDPSDKAILDTISTICYGD